MREGVEGPRREGRRSLVLGLPGYAAARGSVDQAHRRAARGTVTKYLTPAEAGERLRIPAKTCSMLCARGDLPARKAGRRWVIPEWAVDDYVRRPDAELQGQATRDTKDRPLDEGRAARVGRAGHEGGRGQVRGAKAARAQGGSGTGRAPRRGDFLRVVRGVRGSR